MLSLATSESTRLLPNGDILAGDVNAAIVGELEHEPEEAATRESALAHREGHDTAEERAQLRG